MRTALGATLGAAGMAIALVVLPGGIVAAGPAEEIEHGQVRVGVTTPPRGRDDDAARIPGEAGGARVTRSRPADRPTAW